MAKPIIGVMGPGDCDENVLELAHSLGKAVAEHGYLLLTGGRSKGVMDAACKGAKSAGGMTIGILPSTDRSEASGAAAAQASSLIPIAQAFVQDPDMRWSCMCADAVDIPIVTGLGSARDNVNALSSNVLVAVGMGPGTAAEVALALKASKPVVLLGSSTEAAAFFGSLRPGHVHTAADVDTALAHIAALLKH